MHTLRLLRNAIVSFICILFLLVDPDRGTSADISIVERDTSRQGKLPGATGTRSREPRRLKSDCPYDEGDLILDTLDWRGYHPLEIGNAWEYRRTENSFPSARWREEVVGDTLISDTLFFRIHIRGFSSPDWESPYETIRYIRASENGLLIQEGGQRRKVDSRFISPFNSCYFSEEEDVVAQVSGDYSVNLFGTEFPAGKRFSHVWFGYEYVHGLGLSYIFGETNIETHLTYARVNGQEFGDSDETLVSQEGRDTLDWRGYFPLEVGNEWQYRGQTKEGMTNYEQWIVRDKVEIEEAEYFLTEVCKFDENVLLESCVSYHLRYDTTHANVVERAIDINGDTTDVWWPYVPCLLDAPFGYQPFPHECEGPGTGGSGYWVTGEYDYTFVIDSDTLLATSRKQFDTLNTSTIMIHGVGLSSHSAEGGGGISLLFATVAGESYGQTVVSSEFDLGLPEGFDKRPVDVFPNPLSGSARIIIRLEQPVDVSVKLYDIAGRYLGTIHKGYLNAGAHETLLDAHDLSAGSYLLRVIVGAETSSLIITVTR